ncbi:atypical membrane-integrating protein (Mistic protein) [Scopulibacillus cellulosilyticus]|uniref:Atypical membrane-integrating protein (Mistic protein) n=1 Tax=Scopulibacillus cellulosilyticus TaxID=2665665 RepID=A0ABW2PT96_9BACL
MKANDQERKKFDKALDDILELFNELEDDKPLIDFDDDVIENIEKTKLKFGESETNEKINTLIRDMLSWLDLSDVDLEEDTEDDEKEEE